MAILKRIWNGLMHVRDGLSLIFLILFFGALFVFMSGKPNPGSLRGGAMLIALDGVLSEQPAQVDPLALLSGEGGGVPETRGRDVIRGLEAAAKDKKIKAVVLDLDSFIGGGQVLLTDVAVAIDKVRAAKKPVLAFATAYTDDSWLLAAHASEVWLDPMGAVLIAGPGGTQPYFKGLIDRFGVNVHVYKAGKFKSFVEPYILTRQSDEARQANQALAGSLFETWKANVARARPQANLAPILSDPAAAAGDGDLAALALRLKLVDKLGDRLAFGKHVATLVGEDEDQGFGGFKSSELAAYLEAHPVSEHGEPVGIVTIAGEIVDGTASPGTAGGTSIAQQIESAVNDSEVQALVLRVDSPGGSVFASEEIRRAVEEVRARKIPVIVSMGNVAASGGYWVSMAADKVFAEPATITGSIGVFGIVPSFETTLGRYGVTSDGVRTTPLSGQPDVLGGFSPETDRLFQTGVDDIYRRFVALVARQRKLTTTRVDEIAQGRVWDGGTARQLGLVDAFGSLDDAVAEAAKRAGIDADDVQRVYIEPEPDFLASLVGDLLGAKATDRARDPLARLATRQTLAMQANVVSAGRIARGAAIHVRCLSCPAPLSAGATSRAWRDLMNRIFD